MLSVPLACNCFQDPSDLYDGQRITADSINTIVNTLFANDQYLKNVLDYYKLPSALLKCVTVAPEVKQGQPVYFNSSTGLFERAQYQQVILDGLPFLSPSAEVWGLVVMMQSADVALIMIDGIYDVDLTESLGVAMTDQRLYLGESPGSIVTTPPDDVSPVCLGIGNLNGEVLFRPWSGAVNGMLLQWKHDLIPQAAGSVVQAGNYVTISGSRPGDAGWLPASHAVFGGNAPPDAMFGYNIQQDEDLASHWPPRFLNTACLMFDRGSSQVPGAVDVPLGANGMAIVDAHGIWWMRNCTSQVPFAIPGEIASDAGTCPFHTQKRLTLYAARPVGGLLADTGGTSLISRHPAIAIRRRASTAVASSGPLDVVLRADQLYVNTDSREGVALKPGTEQTAVLGPVVSTLKVCGGLRAISGEQTTDGGYHGEITLTADLLVQRELLPLSVVLRNATEERSGDTIGIGFPSRRESSITASFQVPLTLSRNVKLTYRAWVMFDGGASGDNALQVSVRRLGQPNLVRSILGLQETIIGNFAAPTQALFVQEQATDEFLGSPGDIVYITVQRSVDTADNTLQIIKQFLYITDFATGEDAFGSLDDCRPITLQPISGGTGGTGGGTNPNLNPDVCITQPVVDGLGSIFNNN